MSIACRLEAYDRDLSDDQEVYGRGARMRNKKVRAAKATPSTAANNSADGELSKWVDTLQSKLDEVLLQISALRQPATNASPPMHSVASAPATLYSRRKDGSTNQQTRFFDRDTCKNCLQKEHWAKHCPTVNNSSTNVQSGNTDQKNNQTNLITGVEAKSAPTAVYLKVRVNHRVVYALLHSGCEHSVIKSSLVEHMELKPTAQKLTATNGSEIPVKGHLDLYFKVHGIPSNIDVCVPDAVEDLIIGADWLVTKNVLWDFKSGSILLNGKHTTLRSRDSNNLVRRIFANETIVIPPGHVTDVSVSVTLRDLRIPKTEWAMEP